jgi:hypothetical protein
MIFQDYINFDEHFSMKITRNIELTQIQEFLNYKDKYSFDVDLFYHGLLSNNAKSKFLYFFTIIEHLESSDQYKEQFVNNLLFTNEDKIIIKKFGKTFDDKKREEIFKVLNKTKLSRVEKLFQCLKQLNLVCINTEKIKIEDVKNIIDQRNRLYHSSENFDSNLVYEKLFPLVRELVINKLKKN